MVMKRRFFNILVITLLYPCHAWAEEALAPVNFKGIYECRFGGIPLGTMGIEAMQTPEHYAITADIASSGLVNLFVKHRSHTTAEGSGGHFSYPQITYETHYQTKKKKHYIKLMYKDGLLEEEQIPPETHAKRPEVPSRMKKDAIDPLSFLLGMRQGVWEAQKNRKNAFSINVYDGNRLTQADFSIEGRTAIHYNGVKTPVIKAGLRRKLLAGFTDSELADFDPREPTLTVYFSDDERLIPIKVETTFLLTPLTATLVKECRTGESCLLGLQ